MTQREFYERVAKIEEVANCPQLAEMAEKFLARYEKQDEEKANKKILDAQILTLILDTLQNGEEMTVAELKKANAELAEYSSPKLAYILRVAVEQGAVNKKVGKQNLYHL